MKNRCYIFEQTSYVIEIFLQVKGQTEKYTEIDYKTVTYKNMDKNRMQNANYIVSIFGTPLLQY